MGVKNKMIDQVIQLLADLTLTEEEKKERISITQQRSTSSHSVDDQTLVGTDENKEIFETISSADLVFISRCMCIKQVTHFLSQIRRSEEFQKQMSMRDSKEEDRTYIERLYNTFARDVINWKSMLESFPDSLNRRFFLEYY